MAVHVKWLGHASFQLRAEGKVVYIDLKKYGKVAEASEPADLILITHSHADHFSLDKVKKLRKPGALVIGPKSSGTKVGGEFLTLKPGEEASVDGFRVRAVEAYNFKRFKPSGKPWHPKGFGVGYLVTLGGKVVYHAGDTDFIPEMKKLGPVDVALLPTGDKYTMDNAEAAEATVAIKPKVAISMHQWDTDPQEFKKTVEARSKVKVALLREGEEHILA